MKIILISIFLANIIWEFLLLIWDCLHWIRGEKMIIDGYQRENMFRDLNRNLNSIQIPTPININESSTKQIVYKIDGDLNGNIKGNNVTVILMGDGNINGNIERNFLLAQSQNKMRLVSIASSTLTRVLTKSNRKHAILILYSLPSNHVKPT